jgi:hypothetical protein
MDATSAADEVHQGKVGTMARHRDMNTRSARRIVGLGILVTLLALSAALVWGPASSVRGTSESVGYPPTSPPTMPPLPPATTAPVPPAVATSTPAPVATFTPIPTNTLIPLPTSTVVPSMNTAPPATATPTSTPSRTATNTTTPTRTATRVPTIAITLVLSATVVAQGQTMTVTVHTLPKRHIAYVVSYGSQPARVAVRGAIQVDGRGISTFSFRVASGPANGAQALDGAITAHITDTSARGTTSARFRVFPALHLSVSTRLVDKKGARDVVVSVQIAVRSQVLVTMTISGKRSAAVTARGIADGRHRLDLGLPLSSLQASVVVIVKTKDGVTDSRTLVIVVQRSTSSK